MSNKLVYNAILYDALHSRNVVIVVASIENNLVGYFIAVWDWNYFKRIFVLRHPLVGIAFLVKMLKGRLKAHHVFKCKLRQGDAVTLQTDKKTDQTPAWEDSAKTIAKGIFMGIDPQMRSMGLGRGLYTYIIAYLKQKGFIRIDARMDKDNLASVNMHKKAGWTIIPTGSSYFAFYQIRPEGLDGNAKSQFHTN